MNIIWRAALCIVAAGCSGAAVLLLLTVIINVDDRNGHFRWPAANHPERRRQNPVRCGRL